MAWDDAHNPFSLCLAILPALGCMKKARLRRSLFGYGLEVNPVIDAGWWYQYLYLLPGWQAPHWSSYPGSRYAPCIKTVYVPASRPRILNSPSWWRVSVGQSPCRWHWMLWWAGKSPAAWSAPRSRLWHARWRDAGPDGECTVRCRYARSSVRGRNQGKLVGYWMKASLDVPLPVDINTAQVAGQRQRMRLAVHHHTVLCSQRDLDAFNMSVQQKAAGQQCIHAITLGQEVVHRGWWPGPASIHRKSIMNRDGRRSRNGYHGHRHGLSRCRCPGLTSTDWISIYTCW